MKVFVIVSMFISLGFGRPEPPSPYQYKAPAADDGGAGGFGLIGGGAVAPSGSYGAPAPQYGPPTPAPVVHKHVYVHVPPPEPEYVAPRKPIAVPAAQKHYKIVFIKAPSPPAPTAPIIPVIPQNEEKTLVYVLVKKPEEQPEITIPTPAPTQPSKPEVYFIRYKTQKQESEGPYPNSIAPAPSGDYGAPSASAPIAPSSEYGVPH